MSETDRDLSFVKMLWFVRSGSILIRRNGVDAISITHKGDDPEIDILNVDSLRDLMPAVTPSFLERMRKVSRNLASQNKNVKVSVNNGFSLNLGNKENIIKDIGESAAILLRRIGINRRKDRKP